MERYLLKPSAENAAEMMSVLELSAQKKLPRGYPRPFASQVCWHVLVLSACSDRAGLNGRPVQEVNSILVPPERPDPPAVGMAGLLAFVDGFASDIAGFQEVRAHALKRNVATLVETELRGRPFLHALLRRDRLAIRSVREADVVLVDLELGNAHNSPHELLRHEGIHALRVLREVHPNLPVAVRDNRCERRDGELLASLAAALGCTALFTDRGNSEVVRRAPAHLLLELASSSRRRLPARSAGHRPGTAIWRWPFRASRRTSRLRRLP